MGGWVCVGVFEKEGRRIDRPFKLMLCDFIRRWIAIMVATVNTQRRMNSRAEPVATPGINRDEEWEGEGLAVWEKLRKPTRVIQ